MRDQLRAALIALAIVVYGVAASPLPRSVKRDQFEADGAVEELDRWVALLGRMGVSTTRPALTETLYDWGTGLAALRSTLLAPTRGWFRVTGTGQGWGLFTYPDIFPHQLVVDVKRAGRWERVYAGLDADARWMRDTLVFRRVRGVYDGNTHKPGASYANFVRWVGRRALAAFPDASAARVGFVRFHTRTPDEPADPKRVDRLQRVVTR